jgi:S1-C subfamily serine protease
MAPATALRLSVAAAALAVVAGCGSESQPTANTVTRTATVTRTVTTAAPPPSKEADVVARVLPSVVNVRTTTFDGGRGEGSGVIVARDGIIVTNFHVVENASSLRVAFNDDRHRTSLTAGVVGTAPERDLAVLRVEANDLRPVRLGRSSRLRLGDGVLALGFPLGLGGPTVTRGIVSGLNRTIQPAEGLTLEGLLQTDAAINPGNSGGALVDLEGRLVGINTAAAQASTAENIGFAIAIDEALPVIREIRSKPTERRAWLGVSVDSVNSEVAAAQLGLDPSVRGAVVISVVPAGPAASAGVREGDVIVAVGGSPVRSSADLTEVLGRLDPGDRVTIELVDSLGPRRAQVTLAKRPATLGG